MTKQECACPLPFVLLLFTTEDQSSETRKKWLKAVNHKDAKIEKNWQPLEGFYSMLS